MHEPPAPADADDDFTAALARELRAVSGQLRRSVLQIGPEGDFSSSQSAVLDHLARLGSATVTTLSKAEGVRVQSMSSTVSALQAARLLRSAPDPLDRRRQLVTLTPGGERRLAETRAARQDWLLRALNTTLSLEERRQLAAAVELLQRLVRAP